MENNYERLITVPATDDNFTSLVGNVSDEGLREFYDRLVELEAAEGGHKGRIKAVEKEMKNRGTVSAEVRAVEVVAADIKAAEEQFGDGTEYDITRLESQIMFYQEQAGSALLEMGKCLIRIKAHEEHGRFMRTLEKVGMTQRSANYAMAAGRRFANSHTCATLPVSKMRALTVLDDEEVEELEKGNPVRGMTRDDIESMSVRELRENLRKEREKVKTEKEGRKQDRAIQEKAIAQKESKINELDLQVRYQLPPTKEQTALAELMKLAVPYTYALTDIKTGIRKAYALVRQAEATPGVDAQMLSEWFGQYSDEMGTFAYLRQIWTDEVDEAHPIDVGAVGDGGPSGDAGRGMFAAGADVPELG